MSEQKRSQDFHFEFEHHWGGERTQLQKIKGWIAKQKPPFNTITRSTILLGREVVLGWKGNSNHVKR